MKKIFTLIAMALMAVGVNAQEAVDLTFNPTYKNFEASENFIPTKENLTAAFEAGWCRTENVIRDDKDNITATNYGTFTIVNNKNSTLNPNTWEEETGKYSGVGLKNNAQKTVHFYVTGVSQIQFIVAATGGSDGDERTATCEAFTAENTEDAEASVNVSTAPYTSGIGELALDKTKSYDLKFTADADMALYAIKFIVEGSEIVEDPGTPHDAQAWDFTVMLSEKDKANLAADDANWEPIVDEEGTTVGYQNKKKIQAAAVVANGEELELTAGLKYNANANKFQYYEGKRLAHGGNGHGAIIENCGKDDEIKIRFRTTKAERGFAVPNTEVTDGSLLSDADETSVLEVTLTLLHKGDVTLGSVGGADILALAINADLPEVVESGISTIAVAQSKATKGIFNLAGQQVNKAVKGVYVIGGKKFVVK